MDQLGFYIIRIIADCVRDRISVIRWSWCSRVLNNLVSPCCHFRLTSEQTEVLYKALQMNNSTWQSVFNYEGSPRRSFPSEYVISSGTSTGKTVMALVIATQYIKRGKKVMIIVDPKLIAQWVTEHEKFKQNLNLAPLTMINIDWDLKYNPTHIALTSKYVVSDRYGKRSPKSKILKDAIIPIKNNLDLFIMDEKAYVPDFARLGFKGFGILLDASGEGKIANISIDPELGKVPILYGHAIILSPRETGGILRVVPLVRSGPTYLYLNVNRTNIEDAAMIYNNWCDKLCNGLTLIVTNDECSMHENPNKCENILNQITIRRATHVFKKSHGSERRSMIMEKFKASTNGVLVARMSHVAKGFNIPCDTLIVFDLAGRASQELVQQVIGRVRRVQTGKTSVTVYLITTNTLLWKIMPALTKTNTRDIQIFAQYIGGFEAIKNTGVDIHRTYLSRESYSMTIHPPMEITDFVLPTPTKFDFMWFPVDTYVLEKREGESFKVYKNYSYTILGSHDTCITQLLVNSENEVFVWSRRRFTNSDDVQWNSNMETFPVGDICRAVYDFRHRFVLQTGNEWDCVDKFVQQPRRSHFVSHMPIEAPERGVMYNTVTVETRTPLYLPGSWNNLSSKINVAQKQTLVKPEDIFSPEAKSAIESSNSVRDARVIQHLSFLIQCFTSASGASSISDKDGTRLGSDISNSDSTSKRVKL